MNRNLIAVTLIIAVTIVLVTRMFTAPTGPHDQHDAHNDHGHAHGAYEEEAEKGLHGGRLLEQDGFALEVAIHELGLPPEFRVYAYHGKKPVRPEEVTLVMMLERTGGKTDNIRFKPQGDYLRGQSVVHEPHSFVVNVSAAYAGNSYSWQYDNFEGRTRIPDHIAVEMGVKTETAGPVVLRETRTLTGRVQTDPGRLSRVRPRFPGVAKAIDHEIGDAVEAGAVLATVQSNESLQEYRVRAPISGLIVKQDIQVGEATGDEPLFIIADLSEVWVELDVFVRDLALIRKGQAVVVESLDGSFNATTAIDWVAPLTAHATQSVRARAVIDNKTGALRPGQFVRGHVTVAEQRVPLAVRQSALQLFRDFEVVFARFDDTYEVRMLELGRQNSDWAEVLSGLQPGTAYVTENSYLIKADIEKSGASHDH
jgi:cobalt-zinc-cadmium efflux system membrane fusion protein